MIRAAAKISPLSFAIYLDYDQHKDPPKFQRTIDQTLREFEAGQGGRLIVNLPPGYGKSEIITRKFAAWYIGKHPDHDVILSAYGGNIAQDFSADIRDIVKLEKFKTLFGDIELSQDRKSKSNWRIIHKGRAAGQIISSGVGGQATGRRAHLYIIDDPLKNIAEAMSQTILDKQYDWYRTTARTRLHPGGKMIIIMTRWREMDLTGRLLKAQAEGGEKWEHLKMPEIDDKGALLWSDRYTAEMVENHKSIGPKFYAALYSQEPDDTIESMFGAPIIGDFVNGPITIATLDPKYAGRDTIGLTIASKKNNNLVYVTGFVWPDHVDKRLAHIIQALIEYGVGTLYVEINADQGYLLRKIRKLWPAAVGFSTSVKKHARIIAYVNMNWKKIIFDKDCQNAYFSQVMSYEEGQSPDDAADSLAMAMEKLKIGNEKRLYRIAI